MKKELSMEELESVQGGINVRAENTNSVGSRVENNATNSFLNNNSVLQKQGNASNFRKKIQSMANVLNGVEANSNIAANANSKLRNGISNANAIENAVDDDGKPWIK